MFFFLLSEWEQVSSSWNLTMLWSGLFWFFRWSPVLFSILLGILPRTSAINDITVTFTFSRKYYYYYNYYYYLLIESFSLKFEWLQVSSSVQDFLSFLSDLNNVVVWMVFIRSLISKSSSLFNNPLVTVPSAPITDGINVTFMFHSFILLFIFFRFYSMVCRDR